MLSNATVPLLGAVDTGVVGQMGLAAPIGAVSLGGVLLSAIYWLFGFLRMGTAGLAAQAHGAGDAVEGGAVLGRALLTALGAGVLLVLLQAPLLALIMISSPASEEVEALAETYIGIRIWAAPAAISVFALTGWLIGQGRTGAVLTLQLLMNGVNAALSVWLGLGLGWGVAGVAIATAVAEGTGAILGLWLCRAAFQGTAWRTAARLFDHVALRRLAGINGDILLRSLLLEVSIISFVLFGAGFGDV
ncbi:MAG: MATE family efflux transporter, partial [Pseudomonadota bacterium]